MTTAPEMESVEPMKEPFEMVARNDAAMGSRPLVLRGRVVGISLF